LDIKTGPDGTIDRLKAHLVAKGYTQIFYLDYGDTFSLVAKMASDRFHSHDCSPTMVSISTECHAFLYGDLQKEIYME